MSPPSMPTRSARPGRTSSENLNRRAPQLDPKLVGPRDSPRVLRRAEPSGVAGVVRLDAGAKGLPTARSAIRGRPLRAMPVHSDGTPRDVAQADTSIGAGTVQNHHPYTPAATGTGHGLARTSLASATAAPSTHRPHRPQSRPCPHPFHDRETGIWPSLHTACRSAGPLPSMSMVVDTIDDPCAGFGGSVSAAGLLLNVPSS